MTEEEKKQAQLEAENKANEEAEAKAKADKEAQDAANEGLSEEEKAQLAEKAKQDSLKIDHEAELAKEKEAREKAEKAAADVSFKLREEKRKNEDTEEEGETEKALTGSELQAILAEDRQANRKEMQSSRIEDIARKLSSSDAEAEHIIEVHKSRTFPAHYSLAEQLDEAYVIANRKKLVGERDEALRALKGKEETSGNVATTHHDAQTGVEPKIAADEKTVVSEELGFKLNTTSNQWEKELSGGRVLMRVKDQKTGQYKIQLTQK